MNDDFLDDEPHVDFSTILSDTTCFREESTHSIHVKNHTHHQHHSHQSKNQSHIDLENSILKLDNEFACLPGHKSILATVHENEKTKLDEHSLIENSFLLIQTYRATLKNLELLQNEKFKLDRENEFLVKRDINAKENYNNLVKRYQQVEEKCKHLLAKVDESNKRFKLIEDENRKLSNLLELREKLHKVDKLKLEKTINSLKDRINTLTNQKSQQYPCINLADTLPRLGYATNAEFEHSDSKTLKKKIELLTDLLKDYDRKKSELIIENNDLKQFMSNIFKRLEALRSDLTNKTHDPSMETRIQTMNNNDNQKDDENYFENLLFNFCFDYVCKDLNTFFEDCMNLINLKSDCNFGNI